MRWETKGLDGVRVRLRNEAVVSIVPVMMASIGGEIYIHPGPEDPEGPERHSRRKDASIRNLGIDDVSPWGGSMNRIRESGDRRDAARLDAC